MAMTDLQKNQIYDLRSQGKTHLEISKLIGASTESVRSFLRRHPNPEDTGRCKYCGKLLPRKFTPRKRLFCSDRCKGMWLHKYGTGKTRICKGCGKEFRVSCKHPKQVYCCLECFYCSRYKNGQKEHIEIQDLNGER